MSLCGGVSISGGSASGIVPDWEGIVAYPWGGVDGTRGASMAGVAGLAGRGYSRVSPVRAAMMLGEKECGGKKCVASDVRWQVAWIAGARIVWILLVSMNASRPLGLATRTYSTRHLAGESTVVASPACL